jgi:hypothetical protein
MLSVVMLIVIGPLLTPKRANTCSIFLGISSNGRHSREDYFNQRIFGSNPVDPETVNGCPDRKGNDPESKYPCDGSV